MERLWIALPAVFFVVDPLGVLPLFLAMTANDSPAKAKAMALKACITGAGLLTVFTLFGGIIFKLFGVSLPAFRVAGGLLLLMTAWDMLKAQPSQTKTSEAEALEGVKKDDIAIVPLAIPLLAGPGSIATVMVLMAQGDGFRTGVAVIVSIALTFLGAFLLLANSHLVKKVLQQTGIAIMQRVFGLILAAIAVQFVADGVSELMKGQP